MTDANFSLLTLEPFVRHRAYTLWRLEPHRTKPGQYIKVPVHYDGVTHHDLGNPSKGRPPNPAPPLSAEECRGWLAHHHATGTGHARPGEVGYLGAGFRPEGTGLVCIDLDNCLTPDGWTPGAVTLMQQLAGGLVEQSVSGRGAHIWVTVQGAGPGRCGKRTTPLGDVEVYGAGQFIALGTVLGGDARTDHTAAVSALVATYWPPVSTTDRAAVPADWEGKTPEQQAATLEELRAALLAGWDPDNRDDWQRAGHALSTLGEQGYALWAAWSATSKRFPGGDGLDKWESFQAQRTDYRSIFAQAQRNGWTNPSAAPPLPADASALFATAVPTVGAMPAGMLLERPATVSTGSEVADLSFMAASQGLITASVASVDTALSSAEAKVQIAYDTFLGKIVISLAGESWRPLEDEDYGYLRAGFERRGFKPVPAEVMRTVVGMVAKRNKMDSAVNWARSLPAWDGTKRIDTAMVRYYGCDDTPYARACGAYLFTALAGRCMVPGIKADMALILVGVQGARKTSIVQSLAPTPETFGVLDLSKKDDALARSMRGKLVMELAELRGLSGRDADSNKAFISNQVDEWRPVFKEFEARYGRRNVIIGTSNSDEFLDDETGARRYLPLHCGKIDLAALRADRDQLWAEGLARWAANGGGEGRLEAGIEWQRAEELAKAEHLKFQVHDDWSDKIEQWLNSPPTPVVGLPINMEPRGSVPLILADVVTGAVGLTLDRQDTKSRKRASKIMTNLGYRTGTIWIDGKTVRRWIKC